MLEFIIAMENEAGQMCFFYLVNCYEILLCGKITSCATIYTWIKSEIIQIILKILFIVLAWQWKRRGGEGGRAPQEGMYKWCFAYCFDFKTFEMIF